MHYRRGDDVYQQFTNQLWFISGHVGCPAPGVQDVLQKSYTFVHYCFDKSRSRMEKKNDNSRRLTFRCILRTTRVIFRLCLIKVYGIQIRDQQASRIKKCSVFQFVRSVQKKIKLGLKLDPFKLKFDRLPGRRNGT